MMKYECKLKCPECGKQYTMLRLEPFKKQRKRVCNECRENKKKVLVCKGTKTKKCGLCKNYKDKSKWWSSCSLGYKADDYEEEPLGLVYYEDVCNDFETDSSHE